TNNIPPDPQFTNIATTKPNNDLATSTVILPVLGQPGVRMVLGPAQLTGTAISKAIAQQNTIGAWVVNYNLTSTGSPAWDAVAKANFHQEVGIELDGVVQSAPLILPGQAAFSSFGGSGEISGSFTQSSAQTLAIAMQFGALPVRLVPQTTQTVSPTLGHSALVAGLGAGLVGLLLVLLYTIFYYRALGLVIILGLGVTAALLWAIISALGHTAFAPTFSLAGVTGIIVSIGITVDSYIVYFERLKDEARSGRSIRTSVDRGFRSAWRTVLAADTVSLLAAVLLYLIAVGDVRGFAFFLGLSTLMDVFITWYFTRPMVVLLGRRGSDSTSALSLAAGVRPGAAVHE
ncbi:MAG TPA: SecD/SecF family protein translocase subunit, partial [Acidimicrobiales bacterium]|nr:SecD/SecF family protein translocase subunit [Acidimicrobiales bacterium]